MTEYYNIKKKYAEFDSFNYRISELVENMELEIIELNSLIEQLKENPSQKNILTLLCISYIKCILYKIAFDHQVFRKITGGKIVYASEIEIYQRLYNKDVQLVKNELDDNDQQQLHKSNVLYIFLTNEIVHTVQGILCEVIDFQISIDIIVRTLFKHHPLMTIRVHDYALMENVFEQFIKDIILYHYVHEEENELIRQISQQIMNEITQLNAR